MSNERKPHKHAELIKQWADGAVIEFRVMPDKWMACPLNEPCWDDDVAYRVKPEPVKVRYRAYLSSDGDGEISASTTNDRHGYISTVVVERLPGFVKWIHTEWQEVEVPQ